MLELVLATDLEALQPIEFNYDALRSALDAKLEKYRNLVIEDKDIPDARKDRADLNKLADGISAERIRIKKQYLEPYTRFEKQLNELVDMIKKPNAEIDSKIKDFEARKKKEKRDAIDAFYKANVKDLSGFLTLDKIYNTKWDTAAAKVIDITQEMIKIFERVKTDLDAIKSMNLKHETPVISKYIERLNLGDALAESARLIALDEKAAAIKASVKPQTQRIEPNYVQAPLHAFEPQEAQNETEQPQQAVQAEPVTTPEAEQVPEAVRHMDFRVWATNTQLQMLAEFLKSNNIKYGRVPTEQKEDI
jgi:hypothetical protein